MWHNEHLHTFYFPNKWVQWTWIIFCLLWVKFWLPAQILQDLVWYLPVIKTNEIYETRDNRVITTDWFWGSQYWAPSQNNTKMKKKIVVSWWSWSSFERQSSVSPDALQVEHIGKCAWWFRWCFHCCGGKEGYLWQGVHIPLQSIYKPFWHTDGSLCSVKQ